MQDYIYLHKEHSDWITKVQWIPELGLVTSSLDATIKTFDINRCAASLSSSDLEFVVENLRACPSRGDVVWPEKANQKWIQHKVMVGSTPSKSLSSTGKASRTLGVATWPCCAGDRGCKYRQYSRMSCTFMSYLCAYVGCVTM